MDRDGTKGVRPQAPADGYSYLLNAMRAGHFPRAVRMVRFGDEVRLEVEADNHWYTVAVSSPRGSHSQTVHWDDVLPPESPAELERKLNVLTAELNGWKQRLGDEEQKRERLRQDHNHTIAELNVVKERLQKAVAARDEIARQNEEIIAEAQSCQDRSDRMEDMAQAAEKRYALAREQAEHYAEVADDWRKTCVAMAELIRVSAQPLYMAEGEQKVDEPIRPGPFVRR